MIHCRSVANSAAIHHPCLGQVARLLQPSGFNNKIYGIVCRAGELGDLKYFSSGIQIVQWEVSSEIPVLKSLH